MQYNSEVFPYHRDKKDSGEDGNKLFINKLEVHMIIYFAFSVLISRVTIITAIAPFGISFLMAVLVKERKKISFAAFLGNIVGYLTLQKVLTDYYIYIYLAIALTAVSFIAYKVSVKGKIIIFAISTFFIFTFSNIEFKSIAMNMSFFEAILEVSTIIPVYYITENAITCLNNIRSQYFFNNIEILSLVAIITMVICGLNGISFKGIYLMNVLAMLIVSIISYVTGFSLGAANGIVVGILLGMSTDDMSIYVTLFGICGFTSGMFKKGNRILMILALNMVLLILIFYEKSFMYLKPIEVIIAAVLFLAIPSSIMSFLEEEFDEKSKQEVLSKSYTLKIKDIFTKRLDNFAMVLEGMSNTLISLADNERLRLKTKSSALVENLADRVCNKCNTKNICWKRELYYTYAAFEELISNYQDKKNKIPDEIERKCIHRNALIKNTEDIVSNYIMNEMWRIRLSEGREMLASQISNIVNSLVQIKGEFDKSINFNYRIENEIINALANNGVKFKEVVCINNKYDRLLVKISMQACGGRQFCVKEILPILNKISERSMCISEEGCKIDPATEYCTVEFEEMPKYHISSYVSRVNKNGEKENGDSYSFGKVSNEKYMVMISDGMGSGFNAGKESSATVELIEKFQKAGLSEEAAINYANSIMTFKFNEDEKFSTVDLCSVDLYSGNGVFMKVGASASFIKRKERVDVVNSKTLPIGVLDKVDIEKTNKKLRNGDIIVMISDGATDFDNISAGKIDWIVEFLKLSNSSNPKKLAEELSKKAIEKAKGRAKDDITVIVSKIYSLY